MLNHGLKFEYLAWSLLLAFDLGWPNVLSAPLLKREPMPVTISLISHLLIVSFSTILSSFISISEIRRISMFSTNVSFLSVDHSFGFMRSVLAALGGTFAVAAQRSENETGQ